MLIALRGIKMLIPPPHLADTALFKDQFPPLHAQPVPFKPFLGQQIEFYDIMACVSAVIYAEKRHIGVIEVPTGIRYIIYEYPSQ